MSRETFVVAPEDARASAAGRRRRKKAKAPAERSKPATPIDFKDVKVLVVDDDAASAKLVSVVLRSEGCDVRTASSAEDAFELLESFRPRIILIDLILPLMSGLLFAQRLKADPKTTDIVLVAVTAFNGSKAERVARSAGFAAYVRKPIDPMSFIRLVSEELAGVS